VDPLRLLVAYDVEEDRIRGRLSRLLERYGWRVQRSVFECLLEDAEELAALTAALERTLEKGSHGNIRLYRLCQSCYEKSTGIGDLATGSGGEPWWIV